VPAGQYSGHALLFRHVNCPGSRAILLPVSWFDFAPGDVAALLVSSGVNALPVASHTPADEGMRSVAVANDFQVVEIGSAGVAAGDGAAARVMHYVDGLVEL